MWHIDRGLWDPISDVRLDIARICTQCKICGCLTSIALSDSELEETCKLRGYERGRCFPNDSHIVEGDAIRRIGELGPVTVTQHELTGVTSLYSVSLRKFDFEKDSKDFCHGSSDCGVWQVDVINPYAGVHLIREREVGEWIYRIPFIR